MTKSSFQASPDIVARRIRGEHVLVPIRSTSGALDSIYTLNRTASAIWESAAHGATKDQITQTLCATFDVSPETASPDVDRVLAELIAIGALIPLGKDT